MACAACTAMRFPQSAQNTDEYDAVVRRHTMVSEHPLVRVHPETGERALYCSPSFLKSIVGLTPRESEQVLELLWEHAIRLEFTVRFRWEPGSLAFLGQPLDRPISPRRDIFATDFDRQFYRITLMGRRPARWWTARSPYRLKATPSHPCRGRHAGPGRPCGPGAFGRKKNPGGGMPPGPRWAAWTSRGTWVPTPYKRPSRCLKPQPPR